MDSLHSAELDLILGLQKAPDLAAVMKMASYFGLDIFWWLIPLVYLSVERKTGARLFFVYLFGLSFLHILKLLFHSPRPYWIDSRVLVLSGGGGFGMPSGHVQLATSVWLFLAIAARRRLALVSALILIFLVSTSRVYLGAHFISDVIGGWIAGAGVVYAFLIVERKGADRIENLSFWHQIGIAFYAAGLILLLGVGARMVAVQSIGNQAWSNLTVNALSLDDFVVSVGGIAGLAAGLAMTNRWVQSWDGDALVGRLIRIGYGLAGLYLIESTAGAITPPDSETSRWFLGFFRGAVVSLWIVFLAPFLISQFWPNRAHVPSAA